MPPPCPTVAQHVLTYAQHLRGGGVERAMLRLVRGWIAAGRRVTLVLGDAHGPLATELPPGTELVTLGGTGYARLARLPAVVRRQRPDIVFCPGNHYTSIALLLRLALGRHCPPIVAKMSNAPTRADHSRTLDLAHRAWLSIHGRFLDHVVAMTPASAHEAAAALGMAGRTSIIANPPAVMLTGAAPPPLPAGRFVLGVGRLVAQKRWDRLIAAMPALPADVSLVVLGEGPTRPALEAQVTALGLGDRVGLPGHVTDPLPAMARATVVALTSDFEGVPGVLREALSVGTPVVATDASVAVAEIVGDASLGSVVARGDAPALAAALNHWLDPATPRPDPVTPPGGDAAQRYLALFDRLVSPA